MSRDVAEVHQGGGRSWVIPTRSVTPTRPLSAWANNDELQKSLTFNPIYLTDGIQLSDDPFVALRSAVYALSVRHRH